MPHDLDAVVREEWGRLVALLLARFRRLDLVEDALGDAVEAAARQWPGDGVPERPAAWLLTVARRRIIDRLRAEAVAQRSHALVATDLDRGEQTVRAMADPGDLVEDDLLRLVLMCTHPALADESASALALRLVLGLPTRDVARLFLVTEPTMAARITRAKKKIVAAGIPFAVPRRDVLPGRMEAVARTAYLAFTAGYAPGDGPDPVRVRLAGEAVRLVRTVHELRPQDPTVTALLALVLLQHSRRDARSDGEGRLVLLADQDRDRWHHDEIDEGVSLLRSPELTGVVPEPAAAYLLQALVAAEHATAPDPASTRWSRIVGLYDRLLVIDPSPSAALARAVAVGEAHGPRAGLAELAGVDLPGSHRVLAVRAELLARAGDAAAAATAFDDAIALCRNEAERSHLVRRREAIGG
ncbi:sigma-70 family RNA polymerase sigma factor [Janibacter alkaliphilus]|uniref:RNA polymerase sigma-70 factor (ECF subfamily) n=1 Tax=Janibacter alkaliphilus TaxID=1069963 RepID=A0A852XD06_9MICO|nr:RNA polymerase sigma-70 factor (ECF subfamily) [Janibacter alkaliphilus]